MTTTQKTSNTKPETLRAAADAALADWRQAQQAFAESAAHCGACRNRAGDAGLIERKEAEAEKLKADVRERLARFAAAVALERAEVSEGDPDAILCSAAEMHAVFAQLAATDSIAAWPDVQRSATEHFARVERAHVGLNERRAKAGLPLPLALVSHFRELVDRFARGEVNPLLTTLEARVASPPAPSGKEIGHRIAALMGEAAEIRADIERRRVEKIEADAETEKKRKQAERAKAERAREEAAARDARLAEARVTQEQVAELANAHRARTGGGAAQRR